MPYRPGQRALASSPRIAGWTERLSTDLEGMQIPFAALRELDDQIWQVSFLESDPGYFDKERDRVEPGPSPFEPDKVLTMCPE